MLATLQGAAAATGNGGSLNAEGLSGIVGLQVTGTFVGTVAFEATIDGTNWAALQVSPIDGSAGVTTATAPGLYTASVEGLVSIRARVSAYTSGAITVVANADD